MAADRKLGVYEPCCVFSATYPNNGTWTRGFTEQFHTAEEKGSFQRLAELLRTVLGGTFKDSDMKATVDS